MDVLVASYNRAPLQERKVYIAYMHISPINITTSFLPAELQRHDTLTANDITGEADSPSTLLRQSCSLLALKHIVILFELVSDLCVGLVYAKCACWLELGLPLQDEYRSQLLPKETLT